MGNCIRKEPATQWGGDDWGSFRSDRKLIGNSGHDYYADGGEDEKSSNNLSSGLSTGTEVKIKISKKQLEKLLKKADFQGLSAEQILAQLMNDGGDWSEEAHRRAWRPELQSIPE
ncbi:hypothetical protein CASFOL_014932 [Castilleja foliolosa]|uniref:Uncharacterized protein n=1 Tax=Castilleja foliolosa TaxID=1961234 RepID=A0ABD3DFP2_9LAMI